jgi:hypothetical protein
MDDTFAFSKSGGGYHPLVNFFGDQNMLGTAGYL